MVLSLKRWKSRSPPGFEAGARASQNPFTNVSLRQTVTPAHKAGVSPSPKHQHGDAGWSSPVARQAHNLKVTGSNPVPATNKSPQVERLGGLFAVYVEVVRFPPEAIREQDGRSLRVVAGRWLGFLHSKRTRVTSSSG